MPDEKEPTHFPTAAPSKWVWGGKDLVPTHSPTKRKAIFGKSGKAKSSKSTSSEGGSKSSKAKSSKIFKEKSSKSSKHESEDGGYVSKLSDGSDYSAVTGYLKNSEENSDQNSGHNKNAFVATFLLLGSLSLLFRFD